MASFLRVPAILLCSYQRGGFAAIKNCHFGAQLCSCRVLLLGTGEGGETRVGQPLEAERSGHASSSARGHSMLPPSGLLLCAVARGPGAGFRVAVTSAGSQSDS